MEALIALLFMSCLNSIEKAGSNKKAAEVQVAGAMRNVMWKGEIEGIIQLDSLVKKPGMYGIGPLAGLAGEIMLYDSKAYVSKLSKDSNLLVWEKPEAQAPFMVYAQVEEWISTPLPSNVKDLIALENHLDSLAKSIEKPFAFRLVGSISKANIHTQNLAPGSSVKNPEEAHAGQVNFDLASQEVEILGFYSRNHQGIFTHHDSHIHLHLLSKDLQMMGHVDELELGEMEIYLPAL